MSSMNTISANDKDLIFSLFTKIYPLTNADFQPIVNVLKKASYKKGETILNIGQIETRINFVIKGVVHMYCLIDGDIFTINISLAGMIFNSLSSYTKVEPTNEVQEAITDVDIIYLDKKDIEELLKNNHPFCFIYAKLYEHVLMEREQRTLLLQHKSSYKKYEYFINSIDSSQRYLQEAPQKLVSQYLGLAPETFCRAKNQFLKQE